MKEQQHAFAVRLCAMDPGNALWTSKNLIYHILHIAAGHPELNDKLWELHHRYHIKYS